MRSAFVKLLVLGCWLGPFLGLAQPPAAHYPSPVKNDFKPANFRFASGETLPTLTQHYTTVGQPRRDKAGRITNAVLIMHGTTGAGSSFLSELFAGHLFGPEQPLDAATYYVILPDAIGHGKSSKPSDGLRMKFPKYTYDDIVAANYRLLTEKLGVQRLRLVMGTSMGGMETWGWGYQHPGYIDALLPITDLTTGHGTHSNPAIWGQYLLELLALTDKPAR